MHCESVCVIELKRYPCLFSKVTVYHDIQPAGHDLARVISSHQETIETTTKNPIRPGPATPAGKQLAQESYDLKGAKMVLTIIDGFCGGKNVKTWPGEPKAGFILVRFGCF